MLISVRPGFILSKGLFAAVLAVLCTQYSVLSTPYSTADDKPATTFDLHTADQPTVTGPLKLPPDWNFVALRRTGTALPPQPLGEHLFLAGGERVSGSVLGLRNERLHVRTGFGQEITVPLSAATLVWLAAPEREDDAELFLRRLAAQRRTRDVVLLRNGDTVEGTLNEVDAKTIRVEVQNREVQIDRGKVAVLALNSELSQPVRPRGPYGHLVLADGTRLSLATAAASDTSLTGKTLFGAAVTIPLAQVVALDVRQGAAHFLSDLKPKRYEHTPYLDVRWPFVPDASVAGGPLRLAGSTHDKGIGLHSESRLTYDLGSNYRWFEARVGLDEKTGRAGSVRFRVLLDGKPADLGPERELTGRDAPQQVRLRVVGVRELTLVVGFGRRGDVGDHVNWADARLLK